MTSLGEIAATLPNGFHDAEVRSCSLDFQERTASFELNLWVGDMEASPEERELYRPARLVIAGLVFCHFETPSPDYPFAEPAPLRIDPADPDPEHPLAGVLPKNSFGARFFVSNWNAFIHFAGREANLAWVVPAP